jgi:hypothetical protein
MTGRLFSLIAIPLSLLGHLLFWTGSSGLLRAVQLFTPTEPVAVILTAAGILCIAAAIATVAVGSLGAIIVGGLHLAFSLLLFVFPFSPASGVTPAWDLMNAVRSLSQETSDGMYFYVPTGFAFLTGAIFVAAGLAAGARRTVSPTSRARLLSGVAGVLAIVGLVLAFAGGGRLYISVLVTLSGIEPLGLFLLAAGSVLVALAVSVARWSSTGALVAGGVATIAGLAALAAPGPVSRAIFAWPELRRALEIAGPSGTLLLIGVLLVVAGLAARVRARRAAGLPALRSGSADELPPPTTAPSV